MSVWRRAVVVAVAGAGFALAVTPVAQAGTSSQPTRLVTFVARTCPSYTDIAANRARNNIQESLQDLGADTLYNAGDAVSPAVEQAQQPNCTPLPDWSFTMGKGYASRAVTGPWGALSVVTGPFAGDIVTKTSVPLLDRNGDDTGQTLAGAVTVPLTADQIALAAKANSLWAQGGTPTDPVLNGQYPGKFGFGALRCAVDVLNGDNVEWIGYPTGAKHVFCYAYYVVPPPTSGTIVIRKVVDDPAATATQSFGFQGDISYTSDQRFAIAASAGTPGSATFYRAAGQTWSWRELDLPGWTRSGLSCASKTGASQTRTDAATGAVSVDLAAADTVTCTHTDRPVPPPSGLLLSKVTRGGIGSFDFDVSGPDNASQTIATTEPGTPVAGQQLTLTPGTYGVAERPPAPAPAGSWSLARVTCNGQKQDDPAHGDARLRKGHGVPVHQRVHARRLDHAAQAHRGRRRRGGLHHPADRAARAELRAARGDQRLGRDRARDGGRHVGARAGPLRDRGARARRARRRTLDPGVGAVRRGAGGQRAGPHGRDPRRGRSERGLHVREPLLADARARQPERAADDAATPAASRGRASRGRSPTCR